MNIALTMAGKYSRFKLFGSKVPKYLLPLGAETILAEVIKQFKHSSPKCKIYLIANRNDQIFFPIVKSIMRKYNIKETSLIYIQDTSSQLETALNLSELLPREQYDLPIAYSNIDTILFNRKDFFEKLNKCEKQNAILDTFIGESKQYSYARIDSNHKVIDVADRNIISNNACSGLYGFGSFSEMSMLAEGLLRNDGESSFTSLYKYYLNNRREVYSHNTSQLGSTVVLGTPEEYVINIHRFK
jgi:hypothetical protein